MTKKAAFIAIAAIFLSSPSMARQRSLSGLTGLDITEMQKGCAADNRRFCGGAGIAVSAMEKCLSRHTNQLSSACRNHVGPTDFRKYHKKLK